MPAEQGIETRVGAGVGALFKCAEGRMAYTLPIRRQVQVPGVATLQFLFVLVRR